MNENVTEASIIKKESFLKLSGRPCQYKRHLTISSVNNWIIKCKCHFKTMQYEEGEYVARVTKEHCSLYLDISRWWIQSRPELTWENRRMYYYFRYESGLLDLLFFPPLICDNRLIICYHSRKTCSLEPQHCRFLYVICLVRRWWEMLCFFYVDCDDLVCKHFNFSVDPSTALGNIWHLVSGFPDTASFI